MSGASISSRGGKSALAAGIVVALDGERHFIAASSAVQLLSHAVVSRVPGSEIGMTLCAGRVIPVIGVGADQGTLVVCEIDGEHVALSGMSVLESGFFEADRDGVRLAGQPIPPLDVASEVRVAERRLLDKGALP